MSRLVLVATLGVSLSALALCSAFLAPPQLRLSWVQHTPIQSPPARAGMASAYDPVSGKLVIFGGYDASSYLPETWTYDGATWTQEHPALSPSGRAGATMAYDAVQHVLVLYGGFDGASHLGDTWLWDGASSSWTHATPAHSPAAVTGPMLFTDPLNGHVDEYGGFSGQFYQLTTWRWTGSDWQQVATANSPWARAAAVVALDRPAHKVVLFGGLGSVNTNNTWTFDGVNWTEESPALQPPNRYYSSAAFEPHLGHVVLFGGGSGGVEQNDTWQWTGSTWQQLQPVHSPGARESFALAYDQALGALVLFGGENLPAGVQYADTRWLAVRP